VLATAASVIAQGVILRDLLGGIELGRFLDSAVRVTIASALLAGVSYLVWYGLDQELGRSTPAQIISLGAGLAAGAAVYLGAVLALRVPEARQIIRLIRRI
jgi:putative peptidoglycan lipid II flippase